MSSAFEFYNLHPDLLLEYEYDLLLMLHSYYALALRRLIGWLVWFNGTFNTE